MKYIHCHDLIERDGLIETYIEKLPCSIKYIEKNQEVYLPTCDSVIWVEEGCLFRYTNHNNQIFVSGCYMAEQYMFDINTAIDRDNGYFKIIEDTTLKIFDKEVVFDYLEGKHLLSHFFLKNMKNLQKRYLLLRTLATASAEERVKLVMKELSSYNDDKQRYEEFFLPQWLNVSMLAQISGTSRTVTSQTLNKLGGLNKCH